jgi:hypothetical protein
VIDDLIASHKATTMKMESLNLTSSLKKMEVKEVIHKPLMETVEVRAFDSQDSGGKNQNKVEEIYESVPGESIDEKKNNIVIEDN